MSVGLWTEKSGVDAVVADWAYVGLTPSQPLAVGWSGSYRELAAPATRASILRREAKAFCCAR